MNMGEQDLNQLMVIEKKWDIEIYNEIGKIFKRYNIIAAKSPYQELTINDYFEIIDYAHSYRAGRENKIPEEQITISFVKDTHPQKLFDALEETGKTIVEKYQGVYYVQDSVPFAVQIIVSDQLNPEKHNALRLMSGNVDEEDARRFLEKSQSLVNPEDRANAKTVFETRIATNEALYEKLKSDENMRKAMEDLTKTEE